MRGLSVMAMNNVAPLKEFKTPAEKYRKVPERKQHTPCVNNSDMRRFIVAGKGQRVKVNSVNHEVLPATDLKCWAVSK
jgi:hypothetical protein